MAMRDPLAVTVIGGAATAEKSTLIGSLLSDPAGHRLAAVVPDVAAVPIDPRRIVRRDPHRVVLEDGSVCLSPQSGGLLPTLVSLLGATPAPCRVVIDGGDGTAPWETAQLASLPGFRLRGIVAVAPADEALALLTDPANGRATRERLRRADMLVLTRANFASSTDASTLRRQIRTLIPGPRIVSGSDAAVNREILVGTTERRRIIGSTPISAYSVTGQGGRLETVSWTTIAPLDRNALSSLIASVQDLLGYATGIVALRDATDCRTLLSATSSGLSLVPGKPWLGAPSASTIVLVGRPGLAQRLDHPALDALLPVREPGRRRRRAIQ